MASLLSLSPELTLSIIEQLRPENIEQPKFNDIERIDHDSDTYALVYASPRDGISLSRVCRVFRALTAPTRFRDIVLLNDEKSGSSVSTILCSADARHVKTLHYVGIKPMSDEGEPLEGPSPDDFPDSVDSVLSSLSNFPDLDKVTIQFACDKTWEEDHSNYQASYYLYEEPEDMQMVREAENDEALRSLMKRSYAALSRNTAIDFKHLELKNVVAKQCSAWWLEGFRALLGGLESFTINLRGGENGAGWQINKLEGYLDFVSQLDTYFFKHLSNIKDFSFAATVDGPAEGLPLLVQHMPKLRSLSLEYVFITGDLAAFIAAHGETLETIAFTNCYSMWPENDYITWGDFFFGVAAKKPKALLEFRISTSDVEQWNPGVETSWRHDGEKRIQRLRERFSCRRMFDYKHLDGKYGMVFDSLDRAADRFEAGSDHRGWTQVCELMETNASTCRKRER